MNGKQFDDTLTTDTILPDVSAGTQLISLVFTYIYSHLWEPLAGPITYEVGFLSVRTDVGVHAAVFALRKTIGDSHGMDNTWAKSVRHGNQSVNRIFVPVWNRRIL